MAEKYHLHSFSPDKGNKNRCSECPYLANNPIHLHQVKADVMVRGTAHPTKRG